MRRIITANGYYGIFHAGGGVLTDDAVGVLRTAARTGADFIYGDEILKRRDGTEARIVKPGPSPDTLLSYNYIGSPFALSETLMARIDGMSADTALRRWELCLKAFFKAEFVLHIPRVLFIGGEQPACAAPDMIQHMLRRLQRAGEAFEATAPGCVEVRYACPPETLLTVIVASRNEPDGVRATLESIERNRPDMRMDYVIAEGGAPSERGEAYYRALEDCGVRVRRDWYDRNVARLFNRAAEGAQGEAMLFLRAGDCVEERETLPHMLSFALQTHVGAVGAWQEKPDRAEAYVKNTALIWRAPMLQRDRLAAGGWFDESMPETGCEAALSLALRERRYRLILAPHAVINVKKQAETTDESNKLRCRDLSI